MVLFVDLKLQQDLTKHPHNQKQHKASIKFYFIFESKITTF